jgi:hypothetical protein
MRRKRLYLLLLAVLILSIAFTLGNFSFAVSNATSSKEMGTAWQSNSTIKSGFCIYPDSQLGKLVGAALKNRGYRVLILRKPIQCDGQFVALWVDWLNVTYTPVFSKGQIRVVAVYSSAGDPTHYLLYKNATDKRRALIEFEKSETPQVRSYIILTISDTSEGIMSFRKYSEHLIKEAAKALTNSLEELHEEAEVKIRGF